MNRESSNGAHASLRLWLSGVRPKTLPASIAPVLVGAACAWRLLDAPATRSCISIDERVWTDMEMAKGPCFDPWYAYDGALARFVAMTLLCVGVALFLQIAVNFANDYSDGVRGTDASRGGSEAATGKPRRLVASGLVPPGRVLAAAGCAAALACVCGLAVAVKSGQYWLIGVGALCVIAGWFYTGGRHPYGYAGLGEPFVFVFFGLVATLGTQFAVARAFDGFGMPGTWRIAFETPLTVPGPMAAAGWTVWSMLWDGEYGVDGMGIVAAVCCGVNAMMLLMVNNLRDVDDDRIHGKRTLAVRLGARGARILLVMCAAGEWILSMLLYLEPCIGASDWASYVATGHIARMRGAAVLLLLAVAVLGMAFLAGVVANVLRGRYGPALKLAGSNALWFAVAFAALTMIATGAPDESIAAVA